MSSGHKELVSSRAYGFEERIANRLCKGSAVTRSRQEERPVKLHSRNRILVYPQKRVRGENYCHQWPPISPICRAFNAVRSSHDAIDPQSWICTKLQVGAGNGLCNWIERNEPDSSIA